MRRIKVTGEAVGYHANTRSRGPTSETGVGPRDTVAKSVPAALECSGTMVRHLKSFTTFFSYTALLGWFVVWIEEWLRGSLHRRARFAAQCAPSDKDHSLSLAKDGTYIGLCLVVTRDIFLPQSSPLKALSYYCRFLSTVPPLDSIILQ